MACNWDSGSEEVKTVDRLFSFIYKEEVPIEVEDEIISDSDTVDQWFSFINEEDCNSDDETSDLKHVTEILNVEKEPIYQNVKSVSDKYKIDDSLDESIYFEDCVDVRNAHGNQTINVNVQGNKNLSTEENSVNILKEEPSSLYDQNKDNLSVWELPKSVPRMSGSRTPTENNCDSVDIDDLTFASCNSGVYVTNAEVNNMSYDEKTSLNNSFKDNGLFRHKPFSNDDTNLIRHNDQMNQSHSEGYNNDDFMELSNQPTDHLCITVGGPDYSKHYETEQIVTNNVGDLKNRSILHKLTNNQNSSVTINVSPDIVVPAIYSVNNNYQMNNETNNIPSNINTQNCKNSNETCVDIESASNMNNKIQFSLMDYEQRNNHNFHSNNSLINDKSVISKSHVNNIENKQLKFKDHLCDKNNSNSFELNINSNDDFEKNKLTEKNPTDESLVAYPLTSAIRRDGSNSSIPLDADELDLNLRELDISLNTDDTINQDLNSPTFEFNMYSDQQIRQGISSNTSHLKTNKRKYSSPTSDRPKHLDDTVSSEVLQTEEIILKNVDNISYGQLILPERKTIKLEQNCGDEEGATSLEINETFNTDINHSYTKEANPDVSDEPPSWVCVSDVITAGNMDNLTDAINHELLTDANVCTSQCSEKEKKKNHELIYNSSENPVDLDKHVLSKDQPFKSDFYSFDESYLSEIGLLTSSEPDLIKDVDDQNLTNPDSIVEAASSMSDGDTGLVGTVTRVVRRSMRRMKRLRLSGRRSSRDSSENSRRSNGVVSEETDERREVPKVPTYGLPSVRSPAAAAILLPSLLATFNPGSSATMDSIMSSPRETLNNLEYNSIDDHEEVIEVIRPTTSPTINGEPEHLDYNTSLTENPLLMRPRVPPITHVDNSRTPSDQVVASSHVSSSVSSSANLTNENGSNNYGNFSPMGEFYDVIVPRISLNPNSSNNSRSNSRPSSATNRSSQPRNNSQSSTDVSSVSSNIGGSSNTNHSNSSNTSNSSNSSFTTASSSVRTNNTSSISNLWLRNHRTSYELAHRNHENYPDPPPNSSRNTQARVEPRSHGNSRNNNNNSRIQNPRSQRSTTSNSNHNSRTATPSSSAPRNNRTGGSRNRTSETSRNNVNNNNNNNNNSTNRRNSNRPHTGVLLDSPLLEDINNNNGRSWRHSHSGLMASLAVTVTTFNISRFAVLGARFGWAFILQWILASLVLGIPLLSFHMSLGQYLKAGTISMWAISPIFKGVGFSLILAQSVVGVYCSVPLSWMFTYFRDSFLTTHNMFRWADCRLADCSSQENVSSTISQTIPKYFSMHVLKRDEDLTGMMALGHLTFDQGFNTGLIWVITFFGICRGNRAYGLICYLIFLIPLLCYLIVCIYLATWTTDDVYISQTSHFSQFFMNNRSWMAAGREAFLVWGLHGAVLQQMAAFNKRGHPLYRDMSIIAVVTMLALILAAMTGSSCVSQLRHHSLYYKPSSFETTKSGQFLVTEPPVKMNEKHIFEYLQMRTVPPNLSAIYSHHDNFYAGIRIRSLSTKSLEGEGPNQRSGYMALRLATELFPALLAINTAENISPFWSSLFYFSLLLFGMAQQLAVWRCISEAVIQIKPSVLRPWQNLLSFCCCLVGCCLSLPLATSGGINMLYFLDYIIGSGWWLMILHLVQVFAVVFVRGKPYGAQNIVGELLGNSDRWKVIWLAPLTSFTWNIVVPVGLLVLSISSFKAGEYREVFAWGPNSYWDLWSSQLSCGLQLLPILLVIIVAFIQTIGYVSTRQLDLFQRIQLLYRGVVRPESNPTGQTIPTIAGELDDILTQLSTSEEVEVEPSTPRPYSDPPPKYTPPPSYSTATSRRFAKAVNDGVRESIRRLRKSFRSNNAPPIASGQNGTNTENNNATSEAPIYLNLFSDSSEQTQNNIIVSIDTEDPPPDYSTIDPRRQPSDLRRNNKENSNNILSPVHRNGSLSFGSSLRRSLTRSFRTNGSGSGSVEATAGTSSTSSSSASQNDVSQLVNNTQMSNNSLNHSENNTRNEILYSNVGHISQSEA